MNDVRAELAANIRAARRTLGISQEELAARCGLHRTEFGQLERGKRDARASTIVKVARGIGITPSELFDGIT